MTMLARLLTHNYTLPLVAGLVVRVLVMSSIEYNLAGDARGYALMADNIALAHVFSADASPPLTPTVVRAPLYSTFVALVTQGGAEKLASVAIAQTLISLVSIYALGIAIGRWSKRIASTSVWLMCCLPFDGFYCGALLSETLAASLIAFALAFQLRLTARSWALAGVCFGLASLVRDVYLPAVLVAGVAAFGVLGLARRKRWRAFHLASALVVGGVLTVAPWTLRNAAVFHELIPVSRGLAGFNLWVGTWEQDGAWVGVTGNTFGPECFFDQEEEALVRRLLLLPTSDADPLFRELAVVRMQREPVAVVSVWLKRHWRMWIGSRSDLFIFRSESLRSGRPLWRAAKMALWAMSAFVSIVGAFGLIAASVSGVRMRVLARLFLIPVLVTACVYMPFHNSETRYSHPVLRCLIVGVVLSAMRVLMYVRSRARSGRSS